MSKFHISKLFKPKNRLIFELIFLAEILSFCAYLVPGFDSAALLIIVAVALGLVIIKPEYVLLMVVAELLIGSKGYLFSASIFGFNVSLRLALWVIVMLAWFVRFLIEWKRGRRCPLLDLPYKRFWLILALIIAWGVINAFISHNSLSNIFYDFNNWLYWLIVLPFRDAWKKESPDFHDDFKSVFALASLWLALKTFFIFFVFTHNLPFVYEIYRWVRTTGVGEITAMDGGFYRVFFQSHFYSLMALLFSARCLLGLDYKKHKFDIWLYGGLTAVFMAAIIMSMSRSFWLGLLAGLILIAASAWRHGTDPARTAAVWAGRLFLIALASLVLIVGLAKFPYPRPSNFDLNSLADRTDINASEAAISSRWGLLAALKPAIAVNPLLGRGLGTTVTYSSQDPRVLQSDASGQYTTYAFEWGWLDLWLKFGFIGMVAYALFMFRLGYDAWKKRYHLSEALAAGLLAFAVLNVFTPYTNHPLGLSLLAAASVIISRRPPESRK